MIRAAILATLIAAGWSPAAQGADEPSLIFRNVGRDGTPAVLRIFTERPCEHAEVLAYLKYKFAAAPEFMEKFRAAVLTYEGRDWASCWIVVDEDGRPFPELGDDLPEQGYVLSIDEEGAPFQPIPMSAMRKEGI